jgi:ABC-type transporter lipoprotein component MlaA
VLLQALTVLVPWPSAWPIAIIFGLGGFTGLAYQINVVIKRHRFGLALHDWHDWLPYVGIPALGSACLVVGAVGLIVGNTLAPYAVAGATTLLLIAGVFGAWDLTLWIIKNRDKTERGDDSPKCGKSVL